MREGVGVGVGVGVGPGVLRDSSALSRSLFSLPAAATGRHTTHQLHIHSGIISKKGEVGNLEEIFTKFASQHDHTPKFDSYTVEATTTIVFTSDVGLD